MPSVAAVHAAAPGRSMLSVGAAHRPVARPVVVATAAENGPAGARIREIPIRRPLRMARANDPAKVAALMASIAAVGLQVPIDVLEVDGIVYGFSGCHRFEAHERLGLSTIRCRVRKCSKVLLPPVHMAPLQGYIYAVGYVGNT